MGVIYEGRLKEAIGARGIGFSPTPAELDQLKKAGASPELLQLISSKAVARQKPATPPPPATGTLALQCAPLECVISLNGVEKGQTQSGVLEIKHAPGQIVVDFAKSGYEGQQIVIPLRAGARAVSSVTLTPGNAMQQQIGNEVFAKMLDRFGGKAGVSDAFTLVATGNARLWQTGGQRTEWEVLARLKMSANMAFIELTRRRTPLVDFAPGQRFKIRRLR